MTKPNCPCDEPKLPAPPSIPAGLESLPRQIGTFADFRAALLGEIQNGPQDHPALARWRARDRDDLGLMLLEMWAYVCDVVAFYDQVIANEAYLRTAVQRPSLRRLAALIGYLPKPALAASVRLGVLVEGRLPVVLPPGTGFRSAAFDAEPPQAFETSTALTSHPDANDLTVVPPRAATVSGTVSSILLQPSSARVRQGSLVCLELGGGARPERRMATAVAVGPTVEPDGGRYVRVDLDPPVVLPAPRPLATLRVLVPTQRTGLWTQPRQSGDPAVKDDWFEDDRRLEPNGTRLLLNALQRQIAAGDVLALQVSKGVQVAQVAKVDEPQVTVVPARTVTISSPPNTTVTVPATTAPTTRVWLDSLVPDTGHGTPGEDRDFGDPSRLIIHVGFVEGGRPVASASTVLRPGDPIVLSGVHVAPGGPPAVHDVLLASADQRGLDSAATVDFTSHELTLDSTTTWTPPLELPVHAHGNVVAATRGETVPTEVLGSGDATQINQSFALKKKPLTYLPSPSSQSQWAAESTLAVYVEGLRWTEVDTFFGAGPDDQIFLARPRDDGSTAVTFGDGVRGARLPTGVDNIVATYRFGAGAAAPPAFSIKQIVRPTPELKSVVNPVAAAGGADAETEGSVRTRAPRTALLLGRAVSIQDFEAAAAAVDGVRSASAEWRWDARRLRPVVQIRYIGAAGVEALVTQRVRGISDPSTPIDVARAVAVPARLGLEVLTDPRRDSAAVVAAVRELLLGPGTGLLEPERVGIGRALFRSHVLQAVLSVTGALAVRAITFDGSPFVDFGKTPGPGAYFDFESGGLDIAGSPAHG